MNTDVPFVFISYETSSSLKLVEELSIELTNMGIQHWYAARDISPLQNYAQVIPDIITQCSIFLVLLNRSSNSSKQVENEFLKAYELSKPILVAKMEDLQESNCFSFIRSSVQFISLIGMNETVAIQNICCNLNCFFSNNTDMPITENQVLETTRRNNELGFYSYEDERRRMSIQREFIYQFAKDTYRDIIVNKNAPSILDVGCHTGEQFMMYIEDENEFSFYVGIDKEKAAVEHGNELYGSEKCVFLEADIESENLDMFLTEQENKLGINGFDIINISMVILHCQRPRQLLDALYNHLADNGKLIVLDIDDGFNIAYPDNKGYFKRAIDICEYTNFSGYRKSGREIYSYLKEIDIDNIKLHKTGMSTIRMNRKQRSDFFEIYFWFILDDLKIMYEQHPNSKILKSDLQWFQNTYEEMKLQFKKSDFFFTLGLVLFSAGEEQ